MTNKKSFLLLAGLAAYAYYKYNRMTPDEKQQIMESLKETGNKIIDGLPEQLKMIFGDQITSTTPVSNAYARVLEN